MLRDPRKDPEPGDRLCTENGDHLRVFQVQEPYVLFYENDVLKVTSLRLWRKYEVWDTLLPVEVAVA